MIEKYEFTYADYVLLTQEHDKSFKKALEDPEEMSNFLSNFLNIKVDDKKLKIYGAEHIYTGERKWSVAKNFADKQELSKEEYEEYKIDMKYKLIDISQISREELLIKQTYIASIMLIEKSTNKDEMVTNIKKIIENTKDIKQLMKLKNYIIFIQKDVLQGEEVELLEMISGKVGNDQMSTLIERLKRENDAIRKEAREQAIKELKGTVVVKMLQNQETDEKIKMYTDATDEQIEQGKRQLGIIV